jgi:transposase-like protein
VERKGGEQYSKKFTQQTVERMNSCDNIARLSRELGTSRNLLYYWRNLQAKLPR